jgi:hypothetical protein
MVLTLVFAAGLALLIFVGTPVDLKVVSILKGKVALAVAGGVPLLLAIAALIIGPEEIVGVVVPVLAILGWVFAVVGPRQRALPSSWWASRRPEAPTD